MGRWQNMGPIRLLDRFIVLGRRRNLGARLIKQKVHFETLLNYLLEKLSSKIKTNNIIDFIQHYKVLK